MKAFAAIGLLVLVSGLAGCTGSSSSAPSPLPTLQPVALAVTSITPNIGVAFRGTNVSIKGSGFQPGATVTFDGITTDVIAINSSYMSATTPVRANAAATVDVVVTNPDGQSIKLIGAFTYAVYTITSGSNSVAAGGQLSVSWTATSGRSADWISLYRISDANAFHGWAANTGGSSSGAFTLTAPTEPGQYEFRFLVDDEVTDVARSSIVTVTAQR